MRLITLLLALMMAGVTGAREFTSADGKKTINGDFVRYDADRDRVTLTVRGRRMTVSAKAFAEEDQKYFVEAQKAIDIGRALRITVKEGDGDRRDDKRGMYIFELEPVPFIFEVRNSSDSDFEDLTLKYWVVVERDKSDTKKPEVIKGSKSITELVGREREVIDGPNVLLTLGCSTNESCPKCQQKAASYGRDRLVGTKVEIRDSTGRILVSECSSDRVEKMMREMILEEMGE